jgi:hypothetical protein
VNSKSNVTRVALYARISTTNHGQDAEMQMRELRRVLAALGNGANRNAGQGSSLMLDPIDIARDTAAVELECRQAILTSLLPEDELIGRLRSSMVVARAHKDGGQ